jgi:chloride channel 3/4/5
MNGFPIVKSKMDFSFLGYIGKSNLTCAIEQRQQGIFYEEKDMMMMLLPWMDQNPITIHADYPLGMLIDFFRQLGPKYVIVTHNGQVVGLVTKKDLIRHLASLE